MIEGIPKTPDSQEQITFPKTALIVLVIIVALLMIYIFHPQILNLLGVEKENNPPKIIDYWPKENPTIGDGSKQDFWIYAKDPDGDALYYCWYLNKTQISITNNYTFYAEYDTEGYYVVNVTVSDKKATLVHKWILTVKIYKSEWKNESFEDSGTISNASKEADPIKYPKSFGYHKIRIWNTTTEITINVTATLISKSSELNIYIYYIDNLGNFKYTGISKVSDSKDEILVLNENDIKNLIKDKEYDDFQILIHNHYVGILKIDETGAVANYKIVVTCVYAEVAQQE